MTELQKLNEALSKEIPHHWRVQSFSKRKPYATCVPYLDARQVMEVLDESGFMWQDKYQDIGGKIYCSIGVLIDGVWLWRSDVGKETAIERDKGQASDAFKRAGVKWGIGRYLYSDIPVKILKASEVLKVNKETGRPSNYPYIIDTTKRVPEGEPPAKVYDLTEFINKLNDKINPSDQKPVSVSDLHEEYLSLWVAYEELVGENRAKGMHPDNWKGEKTPDSYTASIKWVRDQIRDINELKQQSDEN